MKKIAGIVLTLLMVFAGSNAFAADDTALPAISGYDPVAYFTESKAVRGSGFNVATYNGQTYLFASKENKELFQKNPEKYLPQFGGWCAYGVSIGKKFHTDPNVFAIVDGKLYLNLDKEIQEKWNADQNANIDKAHKNWIKISAKSLASL